MALAEAVWDHVPLPVEHAVGLTTGMLLGQLVPGPRLPAGPRPGGWLLVAAGIGVNAWAVAARGGDAIDRPRLLVTGGPQAWSRNPMYVGWSLIHVGLGFVLRSPWVLATWPPALVLVHHQILREEGSLAVRFGEDFTDYRERVPRYVRLRPCGT